jgi:N-glycosylase/DNA lyase
MRSVSPLQLEETVVALCPAVCRVLRTRPSLPMTEAELWHQLALCVLSSRVPFAIAAAAAERIRKGRLLRARSCSSVEVRNDLTSALLRPLIVEGVEKSYRFPNVRASQLANTRKRFSDSSERLRDFMANISQSTSSKARSHLVARVSGFGPKQASMFLRNVYFADDLAILDSHVIRYFRWQRIFHSENVSTLSSYESLEAQVKSYAAQLGYSVECLDVSVWMTMRALNELRVSCH